MAAERACHAVIENSSSKSDIGAALYDQFKNSDDDNIKFAMLRLLGITGQEYALDALDDALNSGTVTYQTAALAALAKWENDDQFPTLVEFIKNPKNKELRWDAFKAAYQFLGLERERDAESLQRLWSSLADVAENQSEKAMIINGMAQQKYDWAIKILEPYTKDQDDKIIDRAERAIERIEKNISKAGSAGQTEEPNPEQ